MPPVLGGIPMSFKKAITIILIVSLGLQLTGCGVFTMFKKAGEGLVDTAGTKPETTAEPDLFPYDGDGMDMLPSPTPEPTPTPEPEPEPDLPEDPGEEDPFGEDYAENDPVHLVDVANPGWDGYYVAENVTDGGITASPVKLEKKDELKSDWIDETRWSAETGIDLPPTLPYQDSGYSYYAYNSEDAIGLEVNEYDADGLIKETSFYDFSAFLDPPGRGNGLFSEFADLEVQYAVIAEGTLYVEIGHNTYAEEQPHTSFIVALDPASGEVYWQSEDQVAGAYNFIVTKDAVICGYGFTSEPDYLYILNRHNGKTLEKMKLRSAPYYFIPVGDSVHVVCYNTVYEFGVTED